MLCCAVFYLCLAHFAEQEAFFFSLLQKPGASHFSLLHFLQV